MSVARSNATRRSLRSHNASPYARPARQATKANEGWSISGFLGFLNPVRWITQTQQHPEEDDDEETEFSHQPSNVYDDSSRIHAAPSPKTPRSGIEPKDLLRLSSSPPLTSHHTLSPSPGATGVLMAAANDPVTSRHYDEVLHYIREKDREGRKLNTVEVEGLIALLRKASDDDLPQEPFKLSTTPPTPDRSPKRSISALPILGSTSGTLPPFKNNTPSRSSSPRKVLRQNPNGEYRWTGGGSARRSSLTPSRSASPVASPSASGDHKRRRLGDDAMTSLSQSTGIEGLEAGITSLTDSTIGEPSTPPASKPNRFPQVFPLRATITPKNAPTNPSPLRQSYTQASPSSPGSPDLHLTKGSSSPSPLQKRAAHATAIFSEIVEKATPPRRPDLSNPYQTASPVKPRQKERRRFSEKKGKDKEEQLEQVSPKKVEVAPSPKAIIEATVPQGAKRARPPPGLGHSTSTSAGLGNSGISGGSRTTSLDPTDAMSISELDGRKETPQNRGRSRISASVEEIDDDEMDTSDVETTYNIQASTVIELGGDSLNTSTTLKPSTNLFGSPSTNGPSPANIFGSSSFNSKSTVFGKSSLPKEPSKLRASFVAEEDESDSSKVSVGLPTPNSVTILDAAPKVNGINGTSTHISSTDPKTRALEAEAFTLPVYSFDLPAPAAITSGKARDAAIVADEASLPTYNFLWPSPNFPKTIEVPSVFTAPAAASTGTWKCTLCDLMNPDSVKEKCTICDAPRPASTLESTRALSVSPSSKEKEALVSAPLVQAFNFAAAGMKPISKPSGGSWTCSLCMLSNPDSAKDKCTVCDTPRP